MKLLFLNWRDTSHPKAGGAEQLTENIAAELVKHGHQITLLCPLFPGCQQQETKRGYHIIRRGNQLTVRFHAWRLWQNKFRQDKKAICVDQFHGLPFFAPLYAHHHTLAFIHEVAGECWQYNFLFPFNIFGQLLEKFSFLLYSGTTFITVSESTKNDLIRVGIFSDTISIIPVTISVTPISSPVFIKNNPIIISLNRIAPIKNITDTISACLHLKKRIPDLQLWLVGSGQGRYFEQIKLLAAKHQDLITMHGFVSEQKKQELLSQAKVLVTTSHKEGYGLNILEAAAYGTPSIAYNVNGLREAIINNQTGLLTKHNTPEDLARQLEKILTNTKLHQKMAHAAWQRSYKFSLKNTVDSFESILKQL
ncbi:MAG: hypothetical protein A3I08_02720 [Candidatus Andersenbacteria bacterium RIFCSPLOWO2_02_FULL_46_11]|nr:MAG: Glycosyl transferase group 1 [Parcubacteria group bacterium GW2011_GWA2_45_14]OGY33266.1 MAG: hypothetical protein A3B76_01070 [Candidatus Andersenbacteria bacterium RIFCSPHIGHO2_02_FULL_46_16]OGY38437.1 MAG: hypothetical protein A3I08_02720 [Candidatus Andersenbacteria bacterium RIFCSPLOWO2_02_FULL_46_11]